MSAAVTTRRHAGALWAFRAGAELGAAARFQRIHGGLVAAGAHGTVIALAAQAAKDELNHHRLCAELADRFQAKAPPAVVPAARPLRTGSEGERQQLLYEVVAMGCVTESLSCALLMEIRKSAQDEAVARVAGEILRDEVQHAQLGWAHLSDEAPHLDLSFLGPQLPAMLAETLGEELLSPGRDTPGLDALGGLPRRVRLEVAASTLRQVVLPGLARFGVDVRDGQRWVDAQAEARG